MINPFSHIQDILNRSSKEAARTLGREISVEHLMLSLISQNDSDVNKLLKGADISPMAFSGVLNSKLEKRGRRKICQCEPCIRTGLGSEYDERGSSRRTRF